MQRYSTPRILLHWLFTILIAAAFVLGFTMVELHISPTKLRYFAWHKWLGVTIFGLLILRLAFKLKQTTPNYPESLKRWEIQLAQLAHWLLYVLMFLVPLSGYLYTFAAGFPVVYFGVIELPALFPADPAHKELLKNCHEILTKILLTVIALHILAALKHQFIDKDNIMRRMLFNQIGK